MGDLLESLAFWMPRQRWYGTKGRDPRLTVVADWPLDGAEAHLLLVRDEAVHPAIVYQVPVARRAEGSVPPGSLIGPAADGQVWADATTDPAFTDLLYTWVTVGGEVGTAQDGFIGIALAGDTPAPHATARVLSGEQSNTSLIFRPEGEGRPVICKLFRQVNRESTPTSNCSPLSRPAAPRSCPRRSARCAGRG